jgi:23S rRNA (cytosine1962-C5)-methyltransferase
MPNQELEIVQSRLSSFFVAKRLAMTTKSIDYPIVKIKKGRENAILRRHPWVYASALHELDTSVKAGQMVKVCDTGGDFLAYGDYSPNSQIRLRLWSWDIDTRPDEDFLFHRLQQAFNFRDRLIDKKSNNAYRLVHAESDGIPGLIADRYDRYCVLQFLSAGSEYLRDVTCEMISRLMPGLSIYERSDVEVRELEGLDPRTGPIIGEQPAGDIEIIENGMIFNVDIVHGQKTGFYLDQRYNRLIFRDFVKDKNVLNCFAYTGAFTIYALHGGAQKVVSVESSSKAIEMAENHVVLNGFDTKKTEWDEGDVFTVLREYRDRDKHFDVIVLDPPKFARNASQVDKAARAYKDINLLAFKLLNPGGVLITFSCSGNVSPALFQKIVADSALDAGVQARIVSRLSQAPDHPVSTNFPEGEYLKGLVLRV